MENKTFTSFQHYTAGKSQTFHNKSVTVNVGTNIKPYFEVSVLVIPASGYISDQKLLSGHILLVSLKFTSNEDPNFVLAL